MKTNSSFYLNSYSLSLKETATCLITGLTCIPFAKRHFEMAKTEGSHCFAHKCIAALEFIPVLGAITALTERICALVSSFFSSSKKSTQANSEQLNDKKEIEKEDIKSVNSPEIVKVNGNATADEFFNCVISYLSKSTITKEAVEEFIIRGGTVNIVNPNNNKLMIEINKEQTFITGCANGTNRSQVALAVLEQLGFNVHNQVIAAADTNFDPLREFHCPDDPRQQDNQDGGFYFNFQPAFKRPRAPWIQPTTSKDMHGCYYESKDQGYVEADKYYQDFITKTIKPNTHFIVFAHSAAAAINRLIKREGSLEGFTVSFLPIDDNLRIHKGKEQIPASKEDYLSFGEKFKSYLKIVT